MESAGVINPLLPDPWALRCHKIRIEPNLVPIEVETVTPAVPCPLCDRLSGRVQIRYQRSLGALPWQGGVRWRLDVRNFFCDDADCRRRILNRTSAEDREMWESFSPQRSIVATATVSTYMSRNGFDEMVQRETALSIRNKYEGLIFDPQEGELF